VSYPFREWERRLALIQIYCYLRAGAGRSNTGIMLTQARGIYTKLEVICRGRALRAPSSAAAADPLSLALYHPTPVTSRRPCIPKLSGNDLLQGRNSPTRATHPRNMQPRRPHIFDSCSGSLIKTSQGEGEGRSVAYAGLIKIF